MPSNKIAINTLMVQGTTSDAGKSTLVTALCRYYYRKGIKVAPFKPQNMALNSAVTINGGEIGRAQAVQAVACGLEPHTDMNPVLLKPNSDKTAQIIIHGKALTNLSAKKYHFYKKTAMQAVLASHQRLFKNYQLVVVEGAGSPAEINLRKDDIANMGFAEAIDCPVILIADIDKGGVFAHLVGTLELLSQSEQKRVIGFVINRFRGDMALLQSGLDWLEQRTGKPIFGVLPYLHDFYLDAEDVVTTEKYKSHQQGFNIMIPSFPRISNHTDFDALLLHPALTVQFEKNPDHCGACDLIILPGSKSVRDDLAWLKAMGWDDYINKHLRYGGKLIGLCGGYQMLGDMIHDPNGVEGRVGSSIGLGHLTMKTTLNMEKCLQTVSGFLSDNQTPISGYEIHAGISEGKALQKPATILNGQPEGAFSDDNLIMGSYVHGIFDLPLACQTLLNWAGCQTDHAVDLNTEREAGINLLADTLEAHFDFAKLDQALQSFKAIS